jgi:hypothetical protein
MLSITLNEKPIFDTLRYTKQLRAGGVENAESYAEALSDALRQNTNTKDEVEKMFAAALEKSDRQFEKFASELNRHGLELEKARVEDRSRLEKEKLELELNFQKAMTRNLVTTISVLGTLIVIAGAFAAFGQHLLTFVR